MAAVRTTLCSGGGAARQPIFFIRVRKAGSSALPPRRLPPPARSTSMPLRRGRLREGSSAPSCGRRTCGGTPTAGHDAPQATMAGRRRSARAAQRRRRRRGGDEDAATSSSSDVNNDNDNTTTPRHRGATAAAGGGVGRTAATAAAAAAPAVGRAWNTGIEPGTQVAAAWGHRFGGEADQDLDDYYFYGGAGAFPARGRTVVLVLFLLVLVLLAVAAWAGPCGLSAVERQGLGIGGVHRGGGRFANVASGRRSEPGRHSRDRPAAAVGLHHHHHHHHHQRGAMSISLAGSRLSLRCRLSLLSWRHNSSNSSPVPPPQQQQQQQQHPTTPQGHRLLCPPPPPPPTTPSTRCSKTWTRSAGSASPSGGLLGLLTAAAMPSPGLHPELARAGVAVNNQDASTVRRCPVCRHPPCGPIADAPTPGGQGGGGEAIKRPWRRSPAATSPRRPSRDAPLPLRLLCLYARLSPTGPPPGRGPRASAPTAPPGSRKRCASPLPRRRRASTEDGRDVRV